MKLNDTLIQVVDEGDTISISTNEPVPTTSRLTIIASTLATTVTVHPTELPKPHNPDIPLLPARGVKHKAFPTTQRIILSFYISSKVPATASPVNTTSPPFTTTAATTSSTRAFAGISKSKNRFSLNIINTASLRVLELLRASQTKSCR